jgi:uncharacterized Rossmann fold enzyme
LQLSDLKNKHKGKDIYILGSGKSMEFFDPKFFEKRITIAVNNSFKNYLKTVTYVCTKYHDVAKQIRDQNPEIIPVVTKHLHGQYVNSVIRESGVVIAEHTNNRVIELRPTEWPAEEDVLVTSASTITTAMHLAAYMGAKTIFMCGNDLGHLDEEQNVQNHQSEPMAKISKTWDEQNRQVKQELESRYNTRVYALLPFSSITLDGHKYEGHAGKLNA